MLEQITRITGDGLSTHPEIDELALVADGELHLVTVDGEEYRVTIEWAGGLHPDRDLAGDAFGRAEFAAWAESAAR